MGLEQSLSIECFFFPQGEEKHFSLSWKRQITISLSHVIWQFAMLEQQEAKAHISNTPIDRRVLQ